LSANRREFLTGAAAGLAATTLAGPARGEARNTPTRKIATEEAFATPELVKAWLEIARADPKASLDIPTGILWIFDNPRPGSNQDRFHRGLLNLDAERLADMDDAGVDMQILSVTIPGVQMFEPARASALATATNDHLAAAIARHPKRFAGLACFAPQDPMAATREMERAVNGLGLNGFIINSHTDNLYLDDPRYAPILEAAQALDRPIYLHPRAPSNGMAAPFRDYSMGGSMWGFGVEAGTHAVRLILSGVFDRYPKLRIVLGHMGEALPFWMWRLDHMAARRAKDGRMKPLALAPSAYFRRNFAVTTSGFESPDVLDVMWAIDYPYENSRDAVAFIEGARLSAAQREAIFHGNAERNFHLV
jgi:predicted TIM-barrel fold metal-dependent hydrolase